MSSSNENDAVELAKYEAEKAQHEAEKAQHEAEKAKYGFLRELVKIAQKPVALATDLLVQVLPPPSELDLEVVVELLRAWFLG